MRGWSMNSPFRSTPEVLEPNDALTLDGFWNGRFRLRQFRSGHRIGTDAMLLAAAAPQTAGVIADLGAGVGAVGIAALLRDRDARLLLVERDPATCELARVNLALNGLEGRGLVVEADLFASAAARIASGLGRSSVDLVLTNPPFEEPGRGRSSPVRARRQAHLLDGGTLDDWMKSAAAMLKPGCDIVAIHRADRVADVLAAMARRFGALRMIFVHRNVGGTASRLLVRGTLGSRAAPKILAPLVLHDPSTTGTSIFTAEADALHRGDAVLDWTQGGVRHV